MYLEDNISTHCPLGTQSCMSDCCHLYNQCLVTHTLSHTLPSYHPNFCYHTTSVLCIWSCNKHTVQWRYNVVHFLQSHHIKHPITGPLRPGMMCNFWVQPLIYVLPQFLQWCTNYHVILYYIKMAPVHTFIEENAFEYVVCHESSCLYKLQGDILLICSVL